MIHPNTTLKFINKEKGYGVFATAFIPKGTMVWVQDKLDRVFDESEVLQLGENYSELIETYCFQNAEGAYVLCWDHGRFINHSFKSNCLSTAYDFELAISDIEAGEELTDDYGYLNIKKAFKGINEGTRRKFVYPDDTLKYYKSWDKKLMSAFSKFNIVDQPLMNFLDPVTAELASRIGKGQAKMRSIKYLHYSR